ncbi:PIG-L deacetylase family protein [Desulfovibrio fairfieldensis]|uniref:PIG-L deacetylase family protein n=1 Tax=Desulfovibrio fairfieldensis TaxID=44742 RepID=UPI0009F8781C|nr:PIG-L family deacetylase [Desulfovibrio fairfieldensis]
MNILAIGAHIDDVELGCGGTLIKHARHGEVVHIMILCDSAYSAPDGTVIRRADTARAEAEQSAAIIGATLTILPNKNFYIDCDEKMVSAILAYIQKNNIDTIYAHWPHDTHLDHVNAAKASMMAGRHVPRFLMYQSNWYVSTEIFRNNFFVDITNTFDTKMQTIKCFKTELHRVHNAWIDYFTNKCINDGMLIGVNYAESFEILRYLMPD